MLTKKLRQMEHDRYIEQDEKGSEDPTHLFTAGELKKSNSKYDSLKNELVRLK